MNGFGSLFSEWKKGLDKEKLESIDHVIEVYRNIETYFSGAWIILDHRTLSIPYASKRINEFVGYYPEQIENKDIEFVMNWFHKDDLLKVVILQKKAYDVYQKVALNQKESFTLDYCARMLNRYTKTYRYYKFKVKPLIVNNEGIVVLDVGEWTDSLPRNYNGGFWWEISYKNSKNEIEIITEDLFIEPDLQDKLTRKEIDILKNLSLGFSIERLSIDLKISTNTLNTHLRNIRKKMNVSTTAKAIDVFKNIHIDK